MSFERDTSSKSGMTLLGRTLGVDYQFHGFRKHIHDESNKQPDDPKRPPDGGVSANAPPVKDEVERNLLSGNKRSEKN